MQAHGRRAFFAAVLFIWLKIRKKCLYNVNMQKRGRNMSQRGRKPKYDNYVKPRLDDIRRWAAAGATEKEICVALGVSVSSFNEYKNKYSELSETLRTGRQTVVLNIKAALYHRAVGMTYEEKIGRESEKNGTSTEIYQRYAPPDTTAAAMLLRNYDKDWRDKDKATSDFKAQELKIRKALAESSNFDFNIDK